MRYLHPNEIAVEVVGGLGNQLFGLAAGLHASQRLGVGLALDMSRIDRGFTAHGSTVTDLGIPTEIRTFRRSFYSKALLAMADRIANYIPKHSPLIHSLVLTAKAASDGFDSMLRQVKPGITIRGYFQTHVFSDELSQSSPEIFARLVQVQNPTPWLLEMNHLAEVKKPISVHVRRGDYKRLANHVGLLSTGYYRNALNLLESRGLNTREIWVFSDEPEAARCVIPEEFRENCLFLTPPRESSDAESLSLMTKCSSHVVSNSTFSWWGAYLSRSTQSVVAPSKWFLNAEEPYLLVPQSWSRVKSEFE